MRRSLVPIALSLVLSSLAVGQERGAARLRQLVTGLTVTPRVLIIGAHPDDDDPQLMTWLARGRSVQTAYLSLTRGEAGQNWVGAETGGALGAVRTRELLAARRVDGGELFFTRAIDFGISKNAEDTFKHWPHDEILGDVVTIVRAFRPHVIVAVFSDKTRDANGQHEAAGILAREAFEAAADTVRFGALGRFGPAWQPLKLYRRGLGLEMSLAEFDPLSGRDLADIAVESRTQQRTQGLTPSALRRITLALVTRVATRVNDEIPATDEHSIFDGIDTSFARLANSAPAGAAAALSAFVATVDSARPLLNVAQSDEVVPLLARASRFAATARHEALWCHHPSPDAVLPAVPAAVAACDLRALDLDASIDLVRRRVDEALFLAASVSFETAADRELIAATDTVPIWLTIYNRGKRTVTLSRLETIGAPSFPMRPIVVPPDSVARHFRMVTGLVNPHPWWLGKRKDDMFVHSPTSLDGIERGDGIPNAFRIPGIAVPEATRRESDVTVTVEIEGVSVTRSLGPAIYRHADAIVGVQARSVAGTPAVSLAFERNIEWIPANKPIARQIRLAVKSFSDRQQSLKLNVIAPKGVRVDSAPDAITLAPKEQRDLFLRSRSVVDTGLHIFAAIGDEQGGARFTSGFRALQYTYVEPVRFFRSSAMYIRAVDVTVPSTLSAVYVAPSADDTPNALKGVGVNATAVSVEDLLSVDFSKLTTVVIGPRIYDAFPQLIDQNARLLAFARGGGTVVVLQHAWIPSRVLPYPVAVGRPVAEHVASPEAPVAIVEPKSRVLSWPNAIGDGDWKGWSASRAAYVPTTVDPRWTTVLESHDAGEKPNANSLLVAKVGKGTYVYTSLMLTEQIEAGVPGAMRLLVNLMSAGLSAQNAATAKH